MVDIIDFDKRKKTLKEEVLDVQKEWKYNFYVVGQTAKGYTSFDFASNEYRITSKLILDIKEAYLEKYKDEVLIMNIIPLGVIND